MTAATPAPNPGTPEQPEPPGTTEALEAAGTPTDSGAPGAPQAETAGTPADPRGPRAPQAGTAETPADPPSPRPEAEGPASVADTLRFAFGTLTVLPVAVGRWDRAAARGGMAAAPAVGLVVGGGAAAVGAALHGLGASPLLAAVGAVAVPAAATRALHLDGLADTADGLGSGKPAEEALRVMKRSDIGPFGVVVLVLVLLAQTAALTACYGHGWVYGGTAAVVAAVVGRTAMTTACREGVAAARPGGLGAAVAGVLAPGTAWAIALVVTVLAGTAGLGFGGGIALRTACAAGVGLLCAESLLRRCGRRFGGVTGDVFGALCETAVTAALLVLALRG